MRTLRGVPPEAAIEVRDLRKSFGEVQALCGIDLNAPPGTILGLLGPNGAGKTTAVRILTTLLPPDGGTARVAGLDVVKDAAALRARIGLAGQYAAVDENLTGFENLEMVGRLYHIGRGPARDRAAELLERFELADAAQRPASTYSGGMRRRLDLAMTLVGEPKVIFLDEPTAGLDPRSRHTMWEIIRGLVTSGVTIFLTTQQLEEADELAHRIAVLDHGRLVAEGTPDELKRRIPGGHVRLRFAEPGGLESAARQLGDGARDDTALTLQVPSDGSVASLRSVFERLDAEAVAVSDLSVHTPDLDDVFLALTGSDS